MQSRMRLPIYVTRCTIKKYTKSLSQQELAGTTGRKFQPAAVFGKDRGDDPECRQRSAYKGKICIDTYWTLSLSDVRTCSQFINTAAFANTSAMFIVAYSIPMHL